MGGETNRKQRAGWPLGGLSPRGRGNRPSSVRQHPGTGSIPAWAGKPERSRSSYLLRQVYPRVGGETHQREPHRVHESGLSPRGRGNRTAIQRCGVPAGSIPAWAGKPRQPSRSGSAPRVYPRVGGETLSGNDPVKARTGLSPRGRGNLLVVVLDRAPWRSIPAWAGKPLAGGDRYTNRRVYPRVGGETTVTFDDRRGRKGLSPRGRGNLYYQGCQGVTEGSIPAWAGKPVCLSASRLRRWVYPRVGGETAGEHGIARRLSGLSPRGRGNPVGGYVEPFHHGSIPAWAGKPHPDRRSAEAPAVYPRVGGETPQSASSSQAAAGLSPRGRGNPPTAGSGCVDGGSIPAWAGKPCFRSGSI